jgi:hypothetical protein
MMGVGWRWSVIVAPAKCGVVLCFIRLVLGWFLRVHCVPSVQCSQPVPGTRHAQTYVETERNAHFFPLRQASDGVHRCVVIMGQLNANAAHWKAKAEEEKKADALKPPAQPKPLVLETHTKPGASPVPSPRASPRTLSAAAALAAAASSAASGPAAAPAGLTSNTPPAAAGASLPPESKSRVRKKLVSLAKTLSSQKVVPKAGGAPASLALTKETVPEESSIPTTPANGASKS